MTATALAPPLATIAEALIARSNGSYDSAFVCSLVVQVAAEFEDARVRDFVEVLIAKECADELRRLKALQSISA
jgi:hypothetical protein